MHPSVICTEVKKTFGTKEILKGLSLAIPKGSVFGLLGKNGAGKTTLIKTMTGLLRPTAGTIEVLGESPETFSDGLKERFGYVPQSERLYPWLTVSETLAYTASFYTHWNWPLIERLVREWKINVQDRIATMSEGEAQKVAILLALGHEPELLILDEPVASLDPLARRQFLKMILELVADRECTIFFSTHITSDLERVADRVAVINDGVVQLSGEIEELRETVKRIRMIGRAPEAHELKLTGVLGYQRTDAGAILTVKEFNTGTADYVRTAFGVDVLVENLNLEELFLELSV